MSAPSATAAGGDGTAATTGAAAKSATPDPLVDVLLHKLRVVPHHAISLRRNKYRVIRRVAKQMGWDIMKKDKDASFFWLDKWETNDMTNLRFGKVRGAARDGGGGRACSHRLRHVAPVTDRRPLCGSSHSASCRLRRQSHASYQRSWGQLFAACRHRGCLLLNALPIARHRCCWSYCCWRSWLQVGHFLGMRDVSSKCSLGRTLNRTKQEFPAVSDHHWHQTTTCISTSWPSITLPRHQDC